MKPRNPIDSRKKKAAKFVGPLTEEGRRKKAQKMLEAHNYTPQAAQFLSGVLRALAHSSPRTKETVLQLFKDLSDPNFGD